MLEQRLRESASWWNGGVPPVGAAEVPPVRDDEVVEWRCATSEGRRRGGIMGYHLYVRNDEVVEWRGTTSEGRRGGLMTGYHQYVRDDEVVERRGTICVQARFWTASWWNGMVFTPGLICRCVGRRCIYALCENRQCGGMVYIIK